MMIDTVFFIKFLLKNQINFIRWFNKMKNKFLLIISVLTCLSLILSACDSKQSHNILKIGIIQLVEHDALDSARRGFIDELENFGYIDGKNIKIDYQNAGGDQSNCNLIARKLVNNKSNLILAISTPAAQSVANATKKIPILVTAVTDPASAHLVVSNDLPQTNVSGTSDLAPVAKQIKLITQIKPHAKKVGILFCSNESNSKYQADLAVSEAKKLGLDSKIFTVSQSTEISQVVESMIKSVDAIYTPTDNMMASSMPLVSKIAMSAGIPVVCGETNVVAKGSVGTFGMDYYKLGKLTAIQAVDILKNGKQPHDMPIRYLNENKLTLNLEVIRKLKISVPKELMSIAEFISTSVD